MHIMFEHLHRLVAADGGYLLIAQASFHKPANSLVPQVMKVEVLKACRSLGISPCFVEQVGASYAIPTGFGEERQLGFGTAHPVFGILLGAERLANEGFPSTRGRLNNRKP